MRHPRQAVKKAGSVVAATPSAGGHSPLPKARPSAVSVGAAAVDVWPSVVAPSESLDEQPLTRARLPLFDLPALLIDSKLLLLREHHLLPLGEPLFVHADP